MDWNNEQIAAIEARNANILVSAGAGSGKTAVLTQRIASLIQEGAQITDFLIITFTKAAAGEMRERIRQVLEELGRYDQRDLLPIANISTIHAFCHQLISEHFETVGLAAKTHLIDDMLQVTLQDTAMQNTLAFLYEDPTYCALAQRLSPNNDEELQRILLAIYTFTACKPDGLNAYTHLNQQYLAGNLQPIADCLTGYVCDLLHAAVQSYDRFLEKEPLEEKLNALLSADRQSLQNAINQLSEDALANLSFGRRPSIKDEELLMQVDTLRKQVKNAVKQAKIMLQSLACDDRQVYEDIDLLLQAVTLFSQEYQKLKQDRNALDYHDLERYALEILQDETVAQSYQKKFAYLFMDEYQDTNEMQEAIISRIKRENNLFMVGDMKQSIYRFRMADPSIFFHKYQAYQSTGKNRKIQLFRNYRSSANILNCINDLFAVLLTTGAPLYDQDAYLKTDVHPGGQPVEIHVLEKGATHLTDVEQEARFVAQKIIALHEEGCAYADMAILLRNISGGPGHLFQQILQSYGIPASLSLASTDHTFVEISVFLNYLRLIDNKQNDLALLSVLYSPISPFTLEDMMAVRKGQKGSYYQCLRNYMKQHKDGLSQKIERFLEQFARFKQLSRQMPLEQFLSVVLEQTGYLTHLATAKQSKDKINAVYQLISFAHTFEEQGYHGLYPFLLFEERLKDTGHVIESTPVASEKDAVTILSVHKSKGLEYPVVFVSRLNIRPVKSQYGDLFTHKDLGVGLRYMDRAHRAKADVSLTHAIALQNQYDSLDEELRVLYVAMTRAKERLFLTGLTSDLEKLRQGLDEPVDRFTLLKHNNLLKILLHGQQQSAKCGDWRLFWHAAEQQSPAAEPCQKPVQLVPSPNPEIDAILSQPVITNRTPVATKVSVSELVKKEYTSQPKKAKTETDAAKEGTLLHSVIAHLLPGDTVDSLMQRLLIHGYYPPEELALMDKTLISTLMTSPLYQRMQAAQICYREKPFVLLVTPEDGWTEQDALIQGVIDCAFLENDQWVIVDYKSDRISRDIENEVKRRYQDQLDLYAKALSTLTGKPVSEKIVYLLRKSKEISLA